MARLRTPLCATHKVRLGVNHDVCMQIRMWCGVTLIQCKNRTLKHRRMRRMCVRVCILCSHSNFKDYAHRSISGEINTHAECDGQEGEAPARERERERHID